jgi:hypothetical protein
MPVHVLLAVPVHVLLHVLLVLSDTLRFGLASAIIPARNPEQTIAVRPNPVEFTESASQADFENFPQAGFAD